MAILALPAAARRQVFRKIEAILKADATLGRLGIAWQTWTGRPADRMPQPTRARGITIRLAPGGGEDEFITPDSLRAPLVITVECALRSADADDVEDLWQAIQRALYPGTPAERTAVQQALLALGAETGLPYFTSPAIGFEEKDAEAGILRFRGAIRINVRLMLNA